MLVGGFREWFKGLQNRPASGVNPYEGVSFTDDQIASFRQAYDPKDLRNINMLLEDFDDKSKAVAMNLAKHQDNNLQVAIQQCGEAAEKSSRSFIDFGKIGETALNMVGNALIAAGISLAIQGVI